MPCYILPLHKCIEMHGRIAKGCIYMRRRVPYSSEKTCIVMQIHALECKAVLRNPVEQVHWGYHNKCIDIQGRCAYFRAISELGCMAELQIHALKMQGRVTSFRETSALDTTCMHWNARPCYVLPCNKCIGMHCLIANKCIAGGAKLFTNPICKNRGMPRMHLLHMHLLHTHLTMQDLPNALPNRFASSGALFACTYCTRTYCTRTTMQALPNALPTRFA